MADEPKTTAKKPKRRLKSVETIREQRQKQQGPQTEKPRRIRRALRWLFSPLRWIGRRSIWKWRVWRPVRFVAKIVGIVLLVPYISSSFKELKLVTWPDWKQSWRLTWAVLMFSVFFGVILAIVDFGLDKLFKQLILNS